MGLSAEGRTEFERILEQIRRDKEAQAAGAARITVTPPIFRYQGFFTGGHATRVQVPAEGLPYVVWLPEDPGLRDGLVDGRA